MSLRRIYAILLQEYFLTRRSLEILMDIFLFPLMSIIAFGYITKYLTGVGNPQAGKYVLMGMIFWELIRITQMMLSTGSLWNIWARNLSNMFIAPITLKEYFVSQIFSSSAKGILTFFLISLTASLLFDFNIFSLGWVNLVWFLLNFTLFAWSLGLIILAFIFRFGLKIQAITWGTIMLFQPLMAVFFPLRILPEFLQKIAYAFPPTFMFESARAALTHPNVNWNFMFYALAENIVYFSFSLWFFAKMFRSSKQTGQFVRNEGQ